MTLPTSPNLWTYYSLVFKLEDVAGGLPTDPNMIEKWQEANWAKNPHLRPEDPTNPGEAAERTKALVGNQEPGWTTFARNAEGYLCLETRCIKAMFKETANICKPLLPVNGKVIPLRSKVAERVFVLGKLIPFVAGEMDLHLTVPTKTIERAIHVMTAMGPRDALKRTDILEDVEIECTLKVLNDGMITEPMLRTLLNFGCENGLGADRSQGFGRFDYLLKPIDEPPF